MCEFVFIMKINAKHLTELSTYCQVSSCYQLLYQRHHIPIIQYSLVTFSTNYKFKTGIICTLCLKKNDNDVLRYNFNAHEPILIIFGRDIAE